MNVRLLMWFALIPVAILLLGAGCGTPQTEPTEVQEPEPPPPPRTDYTEMVFVPAGKCMIGGAADNAFTRFSSPAHEVNLKAFWIDRYEVTFEQFLLFSVDSGLPTEGDWRRFYVEDKASDPVFNVTVKDAEAYASYYGRRLPTQEEWEKAAAWDPVANAARRFPWGDDWKEGRANTAEAGYRRPVEVGRMTGDESFYGVRDMLGNVFEWTASVYKAYPGSRQNDTNFRLGLYTVKGASCYLQGQQWYLAARSSAPKNAIGGQGFRTVRDATPEEIEAYTDTVLKEGQPVIKSFPAQPAK